MTRVTLTLTVCFESPLDVPNHAIADARREVWETLKENEHFVSLNDMQLAGVEPQPQWRSGR